jgi:anti-sigma-K factor RskA
MSGTPDCGGDAAAYALGALEPQEAEAFRAHMHECAVCRDEVEALGGVIQALPMAAHQYEPPSGLKRRVMREVWHAQPAASRAGARRRALWRGPRGLQAGLAAAVLAAGGVIAGIELTAGAAATVIQAQMSGVAGSAQLRLANGDAELVVRHLTPPGHGHVYEVWLQSGKASPVPASVLFGVNSSGNADVGIPRRIRGVSAVMVTQERLGGAPKPTHAPVIVARIA